MQYTITATIVAMLFFVTLVVSLTLIPVNAQDLENTDDICKTWVAEQAETVEGITYLIDIIQSPDTFQPDQDNLCEKWLHDKNQTLYGIFLLIELTEKLLEQQTK